AGHPGLHPCRHGGVARGDPGPDLCGARRRLASFHGVAREKRRKAGDAMGVVLPRQVIGYAAAVRLGWAVSSSWTRPILFVTYSVLRPISVALVLVVGAFALNLSISPLRIDYPLLIAACALAFISVVAFAITLSMVLLAGKDTHGYGEIMAQFLYLFSGAIFPIAVLPGPIA